MHNKWNNAFGLLLIVILTGTNAGAQNLMLNGGLDLYVTCPGFGQFSASYVTNWSKPTIASSDYYNYNCPAIQPALQVPYNGEGYAGIIAYNFGTEYREYITGQLSVPLTAGTDYEVKFFVSLHNNYIQAIKEVGAYLSATPPGPISNALHIAVNPQVENTSGFLVDTASWMPISGTFTATGGEQYITIGNFHNDTATSIIQPYNVGSFGAYYFVDGVSVTPVNTTGLNNFNTSIEVATWTNQEVLHIEAAKQISNIAIFDLTGKKLYATADLSTTTLSIDISGWPQSVKLIKVGFENNASARIIKKLF